MITREDKARRVVTIVYIAMVAAVGVYGAMLRLLPISSQRPAPRPSVEWGLLALGLGEYLLATLAGSRMLGWRGRDALDRVRSSFLIRFAAAESIAIFGLALFLLGAPASHAGAFFAASIAAFVFAYPGREAFLDALRSAGDVES